MSNNRHGYEIKTQVIINLNYPLNQGTIYTQRGFLQLLYSILKIVCSSPTSPPPLHPEAYAVYFYVFFHQSSLISLRLNPQPDNAWRRPVLYGSIRFYSSLQGKWSVGNMMKMAQGLHKRSVFRWPYWCLRPYGSLQPHTFMQAHKYINNSTCASGRPGPAECLPAPNMISILFKWPDHIIYML